MKQSLGKGPCHKCGSKDNVGIYEEDDGRITGYCFGCQHNFYHYDKSGEVDEKNEDFDEVPEVSSNYTSNISDPTSLSFGCAPGRGVSAVVAEHYNTRLDLGSDGLTGQVFYPYVTEAGTSWKIRKLPKEFRVSGGLNKAKLFGQDLFPAGGKQLVITEGEEDCLAVAQSYMDHYKKIYPVVSLPSASNLKPVMENIKYIQSFKEVILFMDDDEAGLGALNKLAKIIGYAKVRVASGTGKDASDILTAQGYMSVMRAVWDATSYNPQGILSSKELWKQVIEYNNQVSVPYPVCFPGLNQKLKGMRGGEISLFTSGTGAGKSTMLREVALSILENTDDKIGIISLEESPAETAKKMAAMYLKVNTVEEELSIDELQVGFDKVFSDDRVLVLDHQGAITESITAQLNYMAAVGCKYLFVDHITILVSEGSDGLTGNEATDKVMNDLLKVAKTHNVWIGLISHLRKTDKVGKSFEQGNMPSLDDIRGSGSIKQIAMDIIAFSRNSEEGDNQVDLRVLKCRSTGLTGPAGRVLYDKDTGRMVDSGESGDANDF